MSFFSMEASLFEIPWWLLLRWAEWFVVSGAALFVVVCLCFHRVLVVESVDAESFIFTFVFVLIYSFFINIYIDR